MRRTKRRRRLVPESVGLAGRVVARLLPGYPAVVAGDQLPNVRPRSVGNVVAVDEMLRGLVDRAPVLGFVRLDVSCPGCFQVSVAAASEVVE